MMKNISLGQYFPGDTVVHRLDPRTKLVVALVFMIALFAADGLWSFMAAGAYLIAVIFLSKVNLRFLFRGLKPVLLLLLLTALLNIFLTPGEPLVQIWRLSITREGIVWTVFLFSRISMLVMSTSILTYTTAPMALTDGVEKLLAPLKKIRVPVHEMAMIMSMALRFIPTLLEETQKLMNAQRARGANFDTGNVFKRAKAMLPILIPLFISSFRRADELAVAMESRCYFGGVGRTRMRQLAFTKIDIAAGIIASALLAGVIYLRI